MNGFQSPEERSKGRLHIVNEFPRGNPTRTRTLLGLKDAAPVVDEHRYLEHHNLLWSRIRLALREPFAEFFGTFIMVILGDGSVAQAVLSADKYGDYQSINWG